MIKHLRDKLSRDIKIDDLKFNFFFIIKDMIPLKCDVSTCFEMPESTFKINKVKQYRCDQHKIKCNIKNCHHIPVLSFKHNKKQLFYCKNHGKNHGKKYQVIICNNSNCNMIATYASKGDNKPSYCVKHRRLNMEIVINTCSYFGCYGKATHNYMIRLKELENPKGIYCQSHAKNKMISVKEFIDGYCTKVFDLDDDEKTQNINVTTQKGIIQNEVTYDNKENISVHKDDEINIIYDMRNDDDIYHNCLIKQYDIIEIEEKNEDFDNSYELI